MKPDYLWDKTGTPDPEVERWEQTLSALRPAPGRPAWLDDFVTRQATPPAPNVVPFTPRRRWFEFGWPQAVAATVAFCVLAGGLWLGLQRRPAPERGQQLASALTSPPEVDAPQITSKLATPQARPAPASGPVVTPVSFRRTPARARRPGTSLPARTPAARRPDEISPEEARKAKADLLLAFHIINEKMSLAQRSVEGRTLKFPDLSDDAR